MQVPIPFFPRLYSIAQSCSVFFECELLSVAVAAMEWMYHILVIDDDPVARLLLQRTLEKQNYTVDIAQNGQDGFLKARELRPALIICDWNMPIMDGIEVCRRLKDDPHLSTTFFILLTAREEIADRVAGLDAGADEFLSKPIEMNELKARVRAGLRLYQLNQALQAQTQLLETELAEAAAYVRSILPPPLKVPIAIESQFIPSRQLGGDCFNYYWVTPEHLVLYLLDVSGHGVGAALLSISVLNWLRSRPATDEAPHEVLQALNNAFQMRHQGQKYFTIWYGIYHQSTRELVYASAGHPPAILVPGKSSGPSQPWRLKTRGLPIGMFPDLGYVSDRCRINDHSTLYLFSDGIYDIPHSSNQTWGLEALIQLLETCAQDDMSLATLLNHIQSRCAQEVFEDDLSLVQVRFP